MRFSVLAEVFEAIEATRSQLEMVDILSDLFRRAPREDVGRIAYLVLGKIAPDYQGVVIGIGERLAIAAIVMASGRSTEEIERLFHETGDLGTTAEKVERGVVQAIFPQEELDVDDVWDGLHGIAGARGPGSQDKKVRTLASLLSRAGDREARYIIRLALGTMRLGAGDMTVLDGLAEAYAGGRANRPLLEHAYNISSDVGLVAQTIAEGGLDALKDIRVSVGRPIRMMMAQRLPKLSEIVDRLGDGQIAVEDKYDGERLQIHKDGDKVLLFSRRLENVTYQYPDVVDYVKRGLRAGRAIIEGEAVPIGVRGELLTFQVLMQRKRKYRIEEYVKKIPVRVFLFDILYLSDSSLMGRPFPERRRRMEELVEGNGLVPSTIFYARQEDEIEEFLRRSLERGSEGIIAKSIGPGSVYRAGAREWLWIKWKPSYAEKLTDTVDLVIVGALAGRGKRAGTYGALLGATYDPEKDVFETASKVGSGFTDEMLAKLPETLAPYRVDEKPARLNSRMKMDVWFEPEVVIEVLGSEITESPIHTAAMRDGRGLAVRFPRFIRFRPDKSAEEATTSQELAQMR